MKRSRLSISRPRAGILLAALGLAGTLASPGVSAGDKVVRHYEDALDFEYSDQERADLVAFTGAL